MIQDHYDKVAELGPGGLFGDAVVYVRRDSRVEQGQHSVLVKL